MRHGDWGRIAEVVDAERRRPPLLAAATGALPSIVESRKTTAHDVINVGKITGNGGMTWAFKDGNRLAAEDVSREEEVGHVGAPPGAVDSEEAEAGDGESINVVVDMGDFLACLLGGGVEGGRPVSAVNLREGHVGVEAVDGRRRSPNNGGLRVR